MDNTAGCDLKNEEALREVTVKIGEDQYAGGNYSGGIIR